MNVRVVATNKKVVTFIENSAKITGFDDDSPPRPCQHLRLDRDIPNDYVVPGSLIDRRKKVAMVKRLLRREIEDRIDQESFLCIATHQGAIMVNYKTGCRQCHLVTVEEANFKPLSPDISLKGEEKKMLGVELALSKLGDFARQEDEHLAAYIVATNSGFMTLIKGQTYSTCS